VSPAIPLPARSDRVGALRPLFAESHDLEKLGLHGTADLILYAVRRGIVR
jgi:hypothetical protein